MGATKKMCGFFLTNRLSKNFRKNILEKVRITSKRNSLISSRSLLYRINPTKFILWITDQTLTQRANKIFSNNFRLSKNIRTSFSYHPLWLEILRYEIALEHDPGFKNFSFHRWMKRKWFVIKVFDLILTENCAWKKILKTCMPSDLYKVLISWKDQVY